MATAGEDKRGNRDSQSADVGHAIVPVLACVLQQLCLRNDALPLNRKQVSKFHSLRPPGIAIPTYLARIEKYAACSGECFVLALVYIDRIIQSNPDFVVNSLNIHRLLITSVMLAAKFFDDQYFNNSYYAKVGGVPCAEINSLEVEFLFMTNFTLFVSTETYRQYYMELCNHAMNSTCSCSQQEVPPLLLSFSDDEEDAEREEGVGAAGSGGVVPSEGRARGLRSSLDEEDEEEEEDDASSLDSQPAHAAEEDADPEARAASLAQLQLRLQQQQLQNEQLFGSQTSGASGASGAGASGAGANGAAGGSFPVHYQPLPHHHQAPIAQPIPIQQTGAPQQQYYGHHYPRPTDV